MSTGRYHVLAGLLALAAYLTVGVVIQMWNGKRGSQKGMEFRTSFGELNSFVLNSLRGLDETIQYGQGEKRKEQMSGRSKELASVQENLSRMEGSQRSVTNMVILLASFGMLALTIYLYTKGGIGFEGVLTCTIAMMGSFGPVGRCPACRREPESDAGKRRACAFPSRGSAAGGRNSGRYGIRR